MAIVEITNQKLQEATALHQAGRLNEARALYDDILAGDPANFDALCLSAMALAASGDLASARERIEKALVIRSDSVDALNIRGDILMSLGNPAAAAESFQEALGFSPHSPAILNNLGNALSHAGDREAAVAKFDAALAIDPGLGVVHFNRGIALQELGRAEDAIAAFRNALRCKPNFPEALNSIASCMMTLGRHDAALEACREATRMRPGYGRAWFNSGLALEHLQRSDEAAESFKTAAQVDAGNAEAWYRLGRLQSESGDFETAVESFRKARSIDPGHSDAALNLAVGLLRLGRFKEGWADYDYRLTTLARLGGSADVPRHPHPEGLTDRRQLSGKHLLVMGEQGLGDEILFASLIPDIVQVAGKITVLADPRLVGLFQRSFPAAVVLPHHPDDRGVIEGIEVENRFLIGSLARLFRAEPGEFPGTPYLVPDPVQLDEMTMRLDTLGPGKKIGVMWRGGAGGGREQHRSVALRDLMPLMEHPAQWVSLSHFDNASDETEAFFHETGHRIAHWPEVTKGADYDDLAALIASLDAVVCVTCSIAHFSAALGTDTHVLVPELPNWYYGAEGTRIPWYQSMTLYRRRDAWPLDAIAAAIWDA